MNDEIARLVAGWLSDMGPDRVRDAVPVRVTIKDEVFYGARYTWVGHYTEDMMACTRGDKNPGEEYVHENLYLIGKLPSSYKLKRLWRGSAELCQKIVYRLPGSDLDWYVACYLPDEPTEETRSFHPFGPNFMLSPWDVPGPAIDHYDAKKRERLAVSVEVLT